ncbi:MAG TPA: polysaccharide deacetylase family protein [Blastocatellia bacterium]|nr:polysaccharide deacetylase family protein [Blastocatellia bacterium]
MRIRSAGFVVFLSSVVVAGLASEFAPQVSATQRPQREVAITFDDLPALGPLAQMRSITERLLKTITENQIPAIGFVNEGKLHFAGEEEARTALLRMWIDAGLELGNHTYSHINMDEVTLAAYQEDVIRGEPVTRKLMDQKGMKLRYFRHPMLHTGPTLQYKKSLDAFLANHGYIVAPVTLDNNDFMFALIYDEAKKRGDAPEAKRIGDAYVPYMEAVIEFFEKLSVQTLGYEVKQTLLLHANEINADHFGDLVGMMKRRGYKFITLQNALSDKAYSLPEAPSKLGLSWIHRWRLARNLEMQPEPSEPAFISSAFREALRRQR